jgi:outer membrane phospholipase A
MFSKKMASTRKLFIRKTYGIFQRIFLPNGIAFLSRRRKLQQKTKNLQTSMKIQILLMLPTENSLLVLGYTKTSSKQIQREIVPRNQILENTNEIE